jgi:hypothetical protein
VIGVDLDNVGQRRPDKFGKLSAAQQATMDFPALPWVYTKQDGAGGSEAGHRSASP